MKASSSAKSLPESTFSKISAPACATFFGGRSKGYEDELVEAREEALNEMADRARKRGCDAVVGVKMDYEVLGSDNGMLMVTCSGTAVKLD